MPHTPSPDKTEVVEVVLRVVMTQEMIDLFEKDGHIGGLNTFFWEVFCMRQPLGKWTGTFQVVDVSSAKQIEK